MSEEKKEPPRNGMKRDGEAAIRVRREADLLEADLAVYHLGDSAAAFQQVDA